MARLNISEIQVALNKALFASALADWEIEKNSNYYRLKSFNSPDSIAIVQILDSLSGEDRSRLVSILPKRSFDYLQKIDPAFFPKHEQQVVEKLVDKLRHLSMPYFPHHEEITRIWDQHDALLEKCRSQAKEIKQILARHLKGLNKKWNDYAFTKPEPNIVSFEKKISGFTMAVDWDLRPWELSCGVKLYVPNMAAIISNFTFLGGLGISSGSAWYVDTEGALKTVDICESHAFKVTRLIEMELTRQP